MLNCTIKEIGPGWSIKNLNIDPPRIVVNISYSSSGSVPVLKAASLAKSSSTDGITIDSSIDCYPPSLVQSTDQNDVQHSILIYMFKNANNNSGGGAVREASSTSSGFDSMCVVLDPETFLPTNVYIRESSNIDIVD